jgi:hypothetical protein
MLQNQQVLLVRPVSSINVVADVIEPSLPYLFRRKIFITIGIEENPL